MEQKKLLEIRNLSFSYEEHKRVLNDIHVMFWEREKIAILGANGAGKSTFFLHLNGVKRPDEGEILLEDMPITKHNLNLLRERVGIVFQDPDSQMIASTVKAEVAFGPLNLRLPRAEVEQRTKDALSQMSLQTYEQRPPHYLSGGEKKRVSIADILAMKPQLLVFDEPTASLDPVHQEMVENLLESLGDEGKTILVSTHDIDFAYRFATRVLIFQDGQIIADGSPDVVLRKEAYLKQAHLRKPAVLEWYDLLLEKGLISAAEKPPRRIEELKKML